jgi:hypothetical protein
MAVANYYILFKKYANLMPFKCFMQFVMGILSLEFPIPNADALNEKAQKERYV